MIIVEKGGYAYYTPSVSRVKQKPQHKAGERKQVNHHRRKDTETEKQNTGFQN